MANNKIIIDYDKIYDNWSSCYDPKEKKIIKINWPYKVISESVRPLNGCNNRFITVRFVNKNMFGFNTEKTVSISAINKQRVNDDYLPSMDGGFCIGNILTKENGIFTQEYNIWRSMYRIYINSIDDTESTNKVDVVPEWHCYEFFYKSLKSVTGYNNWVNNNKTGYIFNRKFYDANNSIYAPDKVAFVPEAFNVSINESKCIGTTALGSAGYYGVFYHARTNGYTVIVNYISFGVYDNKDIAASLYNHIMDIVDNEHSMPRNDVINYNILTIMKHKISDPIRIDDKYLMYKIFETKQNDLDYTDNISFNNIDDVTIENVINSSSEILDTMQYDTLADMIGVIFTSNKYGPFQILKYFSVNSKGYITIKFMQPNMFGKNTIIDVLSVNLLRPPFMSSIKDPYAFNDNYYYGFACTGLVLKQFKPGSRCREYEIWLFIIKKIFNENNKAYKNNGAKGISVYYNWRCYEYFLYDLPKIPNYDLWLNNPGVYEFDKDMLQRGVPDNDKIYSPQTCMFVKKSYNSLEATLRKRYPLNWYGVVKTKTHFRTMCNNYCIGAYTTYEAAANRHNHYLIERYGNDVPFALMNDVPYISPVDLVIKYTYRGK